jgi:hypothetical protein
MIAKLRIESTGIHSIHGKDEMGADAARNLPLITISYHSIAWTGPNSSVPG